MQVQEMIEKRIDKLEWFERKDKDDKSTSLGYGARFDPLFKNAKIFDNRDVMRVIFKVPWWMHHDERQLQNAIRVLRKYHTVPNIIDEIEDDEYQQDRDAYRDYVQNAGPKYADRKKKLTKSKPNRKITKCRCKK